VERRWGESDKEYNDRLSKEQYKETVRNNELLEEQNEYLQDQKKRENKREEIRKFDEYIGTKREPDPESESHSDRNWPHRMPVLKTTEALKEDLREAKKTGNKEEALSVKEQIKRRDQKSRAQQREDWGKVSIKSMIKVALVYMPLLAVWTFMAGSLWNKDVSYQYVFPVVELVIAFLVLYKCKGYTTKNSMILAIVIAVANLFVPLAIITGIYLIYLYGSSNRNDSHSIYMA
jgi:hypothetical protein